MSADPEDVEVAGDEVMDPKDFGGDETGTNETSWTKAGILGLVAGWLIKALVFTPAATLFGYIDSGVDLLTGSIESTLKISLNAAGSSVYDAVLGPGGIVTQLRVAIISIAASSGIGSPIAVGLANTIIILATVGLVYLLIRAGAGYVSGGLLS